MGRSDIAWLLVGAVGGALFQGYAGVGSVARTRRVQAVGLLVAAVIYVGFALPFARVAWLGIEAAGVGVFGGLAVLGGRGRPPYLALGWGLHAVWDAWLHLLGAGAGIAPRWYALACVSFDLVVAAAIVAAVLRERRAARVNGPGVGIAGG